MRRIALPCALAILASAASGQQVFVIDDDGGPGVDYLDLQPAVDAASPGSVLVVRGGEYTPFDLDGKGLSILGVDGARVNIRMTPTGTGCRIANLPAGERAVLAGFTVRHDAGGAVDNFLRIESTGGLVWIQDLTLEYVLEVISIFGFSSSQPAAVGVSAADRVVISGCRILGMPGSNQGQGSELGADGLVIADSVVDIYDTSIKGGYPTFGGGTGNDGLRVTDGTVTIHGGSIVGGTGGPADTLVGAQEGTGGTALVVGANSTVRVLGGSLQGGAGGGGPFSPGPMGSRIELDPGATLFEFDVLAATLQAPSLAGDDESLSVTLLGEPDAVALLFVSFSPSPVYLGNIPGTSALGLAPGFFPATVLDGLGETTIPFGSLPLPAGLDSFAAAVQAATLDSIGRVSLTNPTLATIVDAATP